ncbi:MAG: trehalose-6-phosphate synthase, partial [Candidatus Acidiferrales bacterium]
MTALLVVGITLVTFLVARSQVRSEKQGMRDDLQRRAEVLAESLQEIIEPILEKNETNQLRRVVERFQNREHLDGVGIYGPQGQLVAESSSLGATFQAPQMSIATARLQDRGFGELRTLGGNSTHIYYQPLHHTIDANGKPLQHATDVIGVLTIYHDAGYIEAQTEQVWRETLWHVVIQVLLIVLITVALLRWAIFLPLTRTEQWIRELRSGRGAPRSPLPTEELFQPLSREVAKLAQSLTEARASAEEEARLRETGESLWTAERLRISMQTKLRGRPLFVVSNREPYEHVRRGKTIETMVPASGLVTALEPILRACGGTWIANASGDADRDVVDKHDRVRVPPEQPEYTLRRIWIDEEAYDGYYLGFANEGLWPLCHIAHTRPIFRISDWEHYSEVNSQFCDAVLKEMEGAVEPIVLIQDYHFALLPRLIKQKRPDARVAIFWHIPWPNPEAFHICPWQKELLDGLLGADLVSFHIQAHCNNFLETIDRALESRIDWDRFSVNRGDQTTLVRPHPISVAWPERHGRPPARVTPEERTAILQSLDVEASFVGLGVDRLDYTKGIMERFRGIESFLQKNPSMREHFTFIQ